MKVILLDNIKGVGKKDEVINASDGYARNFLFPKKLAVEANAENMAKLKGKQDSASHKKAVEKDEAKQIATGAAKDVIKKVTEGAANNVMDEYVATPENAGMPNAVKRESRDNLILSY